MGEGDNRVQEGQMAVAGGGKGRSSRWGAVRARSGDKGQLRPDEAARARWGTRAKMMG